MKKLNNIYNTYISYQLKKYCTIAIAVIYISTLYMPSLIYSQDISHISSTITSGAVSDYETKLRERSAFALQVEREDIENLKKIYATSQPQQELDLQSAKLNINQIATELDRISKEFDKLSSDKKVINEKYAEVKTSIKAILSQSSKIRDVINDRVSKLTTYTRETVQLKKDIKEAENNIEQAKTLLIRFGNVLYMVNNEFYTQDLEIDDIKLLSKSNNIANTLSNEQLIAILAKRVDQLISYINTQQNDMSDKLKIYNQTRIKYRDEVASYRKEIELLNEQKKYLLEFIKLYREDKINLSLEEANLFDDFAKVKKQIDQDIFKTINIGGDIGNKLKALQVDPDRYDSGNYIGRPVFPIVNILGNFNDTQYIAKYGKNNMGIDIPVAMFTPVYAPADAVVYKVKNTNGIALNWLILVHPHGYVTLLTTLNKIYASEGQVVRRGQLIGISGGEPGSRGAGFGSLGSRIHMEVFKNGQAINPLSQLDLSVVMVKQAIPLEFEIKYLQDKMSRKIDLSQVEIMPGQTVSERRLEYLSRNGFGEFGKIDLWEDAAAGQYIDIDLGICTAVAESSMGRNLSSPRNVGNVGNNDRGDRVALGSALEGAGMIFYAMNNKFLGQYHTIYKLNGYGNKSGPIYASSPINRQTNIMRCLTAIKGYRVPEEYPFRLPRE